MQPKPPNPPQPAPEPPALTVAPSDTVLDATPQNYYQAIGWLRGKLIRGEEEKRFCIQIREAAFTLYLPKRMTNLAEKLVDQQIWLKCYPQSKGEGLSFKGVWMGLEQAEKGEPGIFILRGVWQFIPQCRRPVFSIYRNELKAYENRPSNQHLPLIWTDQPPYRFRKDSEDRPKFYQITARLIAQRGCFGFVSQIAEPLEQTPRRVKKPPLEGVGVKGPGKFKKHRPESEESGVDPLTPAPEVESSATAPAEPESPASVPAAKTPIVQPAPPVVEALNPAPETLAPEAVSPTPESPVAEPVKTKAKTKAKAKTKPS